MPPERNGIADYAAILLGGLAAHYECRVACEDWLGQAPTGVPVLDPALAHRGAGPRVLHQIGNNPGHGFVLRGLRGMPGVTTLHDPGLLHLHETMGEDARRSAPAWPRRCRASPPSMAGTCASTASRPAPTTCCSTWRARCWRARAPSSCIPRYARNRLRLVHGPAATAHVAVIPHFLPPATLPDRAAARARLGLPQDGFLVLTAGFATAAKRFDWLIEALDILAGRGTRCAGSMPAPSGRRNTR